MLSKRFNDLNKLAVYALTAVLVMFFSTLFVVSIIAEDYLVTRVDESYIHTCSNLLLYETELELKIPEVCDFYFEPPSEPEPSLFKKIRSFLKG
jgi:hypothetical protein